MMYSDTKRQKSEEKRDKFCHVQMASGRSRQQLGRTMPDVRPVILRAARPKEKSPNKR